MVPPHPTPLLRAARAGGYALAAFNAINLETAQAIVAAAERERAPVMLQISENAARYAGLGNLFGIGKRLQEAASVPIVLHFDHAECLESALGALELGFDSVMLEGADLGPEENVRQLQVLAEAARARGALVEGEFEIVQKGGRSGESLPPETIRDLVEASHCDTVAIDIGSRHKMLQQTAGLDLRRLERISGLVPHPLVLHGSSGVGEAGLAAAVRLGIAKVNVATGLMVAFTDGARASLADAGLYDPRAYLGAAREAMCRRAQGLIRLLGGAGKAA